MKYMPKDYFPQQTDITPRMRYILIDWIIEVQYKYDYSSLTLWRSANYLDRYLEKNNIERLQLQLVGVTCFFLATKIEERTRAFQVADCIKLTNSAFNKENILQMESQILASLDYDLLGTTIYHFLLRSLSLVKATERISLIANFIAERNLLEADFLLLSPRTFAAACVYVALSIENYPNQLVWSSDLTEEVGKERDLIIATRLLIQHMKGPRLYMPKRSLDAVYKKYSVPQRQYVAQIDFSTL